MYTEFERLTKQGLVGG